MLGIQYACFSSGHLQSNNTKTTKDNHEKISYWRPELSKRCSRRKKNTEWWEPELSKRCSKKKKE